MALARPLAGSCCRVMAEARTPATWLRKGPEPPSERAAEARASTRSRSRPRAWLLPDPGPPKRPMVKGVSVPPWAIASAAWASGWSAPRRSGPDGLSEANTALRAEVGGAAAGELFEAAQLGGIGGAAGSIRF